MSRQNSSRFVMYSGRWPKFLERRWLAYCIIMVLAIAGVPGVQWLFPAAEASLDTWPAIAAVWLVAIAASAWAVLGTRQRFLHAIERRGMVCWECGHDLYDPAPAGSCPVCGNAYTTAELVDRWSQPRGILSRRWRDFPPMAVRRGAVVATVGLGLAIIGQAVLILFTTLAPRPTLPGASQAAIVAWFRWSTLMIIVAQLAQLAALISMVLIFRMFVMLYRRARGLHARMCGRCGHDLTGLGDSGVCGECGWAFEIGSLRRMWGVKGTRDACDVR